MDLKMVKKMEKNFFCCGLKSYGLASGLASGQLSVHQSLAGMDTIPYAALMFM